MKTSAIGKNAENAVAKFLQKNGFEIIAQNWRTRVCEIDLIAKKDGVMFFVEVKYRRRSNHGEGVEYITPVKLKQMNYAAAVWNMQSNWEADYRLLAASVAGLDFEDIKIIEV